MGGYASTYEQTDLEKIFAEQGPDAFVEEVWERTVCQEDYDQLKGIDFDFDSLAFEGGGVKGVAYAGAVKALSDLGILQKIRRFAGTSAGAYMAMQLAIGMPVDEIFKKNGIPSLEESFYDSSTWAFPFNFLKRYGWHSGQKLKCKIEDDLEEYLGNRRITFYELYKTQNVELCVVVTDLNSRSVEYCHPKTTPSVAVADAVRTSMSLPFVFAPTEKKAFDGVLRYFIDGAVLENYPIRVYDGWYLSMHKDDSFLRRFKAPVSTKFQGVNTKSLGMVVFSHGEHQSNADEYLNRYGEDLLTGRPNTKLATENKHTAEKICEESQQTKMNESAQVLIKFLAEEIDSKGDTDYGVLTLEQFRAAVEKIKADPELKGHLDTLVGEDGLDPLETSFKEADTTGDDKLSLPECLSYLQTKGVYLRYNLKTRYPRRIGNLTSYIMSITDVMMSYISELQEKKEDVDRTIGIYTDYVTTTDFDMALDDKVFMIKQGYKATINYLKTVKPPPARSERLTYRPPRHI